MSSLTRWRDPSGNFPRRANPLWWPGRAAPGRGGRLRDPIDFVRAVGRTGVQATSRHLFQLLVTKALDMGSVGADELGTGDGETGFLGESDGIGSLGPQLFPEGGVLADSFEKF